MSCGSRNLITGGIQGHKIYLWSPMYGVGETFEFKKDDTFIFKWQQGLIQGETIGSYTKKESSLFLSSSKQPVKTEKFKIKSLSNTKNDKEYYVKVIDKKNAPFGYANCFFIKNDSIIGGTLAKEDGAITFSKDDNFDKILISFVAHYDAEIDLKEISSNSIEVVLVSKPEYYEFFTNELLKIRGNKILRYDIDSNGKKRRKVYKINTSQKSSHQPLPESLNNSALVQLGKNIFRYRHNMGYRLY